MHEILSHRHIRYFCLTVVLLAFLSGALRTAIPLLATKSGYGVLGVSWSQGLFSLAWPLFGIVAGILLDRNEKVVLAVRALALFIVVHLILFLMYALQFIPVEQIFVYAMIAGIIVVSAEAYMLTVPPLIMEGDQLTSFYSIVLFLDFGFSYFIGPVVTTAVLTSSPQSFYLLIIAVLIATIWTVQLATPELPPINKSSITINYIMAGFRFIFSNRQLTSLTILTFFLSVVFGAFLTSFVLFVTGDQYLGLDVSQYGIMFGAYAVGSMTGALFVRQLLGSTSVRTAVLADGVGTVALLIVPAFCNNALLVWLTTFLAGVGLSLWFVAVTAFRQRLTPRDLLGRTNSAFRVIGYAGMPIGSLLVGVLGSLASLQFAAIIIAGLLLLALAITLPLIWSVDVEPECQELEF